MKYIHIYANSLSGGASCLWSTNVSADIVKSSTRTNLSTKNLSERQFKNMVLDKMDIGDIF